MKEYNGWLTNHIRFIGIWMSTEPPHIVTWDRVHYVV
jgi:hypothetical protein